MKPFCPAYPAPRKRRASPLALFIGARRSWLETLYERSYAMQMGEVHLPGLDLYMINEAALVRRVLVQQAPAFPKSRALVRALAPLLGKGLLLADGEAWRRQRRMMQPAFSQAGLDGVFPVMRAAADAMLQRLAAQPDGAVHDVEVEMTHVTADVMLRTLFSLPLASQDARRVFEAFRRYQASAPQLAVPAMFGVGWLASPWHRWRSARASAEIRRLLIGLVRPRYDAHRAGGAPSGDLLGALLQARDATTGAPFDFEELVDEVAVLFLAGHETSASALTWALHLLARAPHVQQRAHEEVMAVLGGREPQLHAMKDLALVRNVFRETLRLFPPVGFIARESSQACPMRDKQVPAGATVMVAPWLIQRHRALWEAPDSFDPDRWNTAAAQDSAREAYLPFGLGPRACMGAAFAIQEAALVLATLLRAYRLEPAGDEPWPVGRLTIRPEHGVRLALHRRNQA